MDIVTHGMVGVALAGPLLGTHPLEASGFILGSVAPDLDALSRCFGKRAFLDWHQGWTHAFPVIAVCGLCGCALAKLLWPEAAGLVVGLCLGAALHSFLDLTNTYGVRALAPFSRRRFCREWLFFIDAGVVLFTIPAAIVVVTTLRRPDAIGRTVAIMYGTTLALYVAARAVMRGIAGRKCKDDNVVSMIPSALCPWVYFVCARDPDSANAVVRLFRLNALTGRRTQATEQPIFDALVRTRLETLPEFQAMAALSPAYHVVSYQPDGDRIRVACRDLRTVNFNTTFGALQVVLNAERGCISAELNV